MYTSSQKSCVCGPAALVLVPGSKRSIRVATPDCASVERIRSNRPSTTPGIAAVHGTSVTGKNSRSGFGIPAHLSIHAELNRNAPCWLRPMSFTYDFVSIRAGAEEMESTNAWSSSKSFTWS